jgi:hypothetical protein
MSIFKPLKMSYMNHILLANIGNRSLKVNGMVTSSRPEGKSFRDLMHEILQNMDTMNIELNILDVFIKKWNVFEKIYLFASDGTLSGQDKTDQDTIDAAQIVRNILIEQYQYAPEQIEVVPYTGNPTQEESLMKFYFHFIRTTLLPGLNAKIIVADAGGTAQMRNGLKIACEFLLGKHAWEAHYKKINSDEIEQLPLYTYRRIISTEQYIQLLSLGEYNTAEILFSDDNGETNLRHALLLSKVAALRRDGLYEELNKYEDKLNENEDLRIYSRASFSKTNSPLIERLDTLHALRIVDIFSLAELYALNRNYSQFCLQYCIGMEVFTQCMLSGTYVYNGKKKEVDIQYEIKYKHKELLKDYLVSEQQEFIDHFIKIMGIEYEIENKHKELLKDYLVSELQDKFFDHFSKILSNENISITFPLLLHYLNHIINEEKNQSIQSFITLMMQIHSTGNLDGTNNKNTRRGIDKLRNKVAHKGEYISESLFTEEMKVKNIDSAIILCEMTKKQLGFQNTFIEINKTLEQLLRR